MLISSFVAAQDLATAKQLWTDKRIVAAKEAIDSYLADAGSEDAEAWLLKASIYTSISTDSQLKSLVADGKMDAFQALKRAAAINPQIAKAQLKPRNFDIIHTLYKGCINDGVAFFNAGSEKKAIGDYATALDYFKKAFSISQFVREQDWNLAFTPNDSIVLYIATQAAINAQKEDDAVLYCRKLADKAINRAGAYDKQDFENIYQWLVNYFNIKKDVQNLQKYALIGGKLYPRSLYFATIAIASYRETDNYPGLITASEAAIKAIPQHHFLRYNYCADLFTYIYTETALKARKDLYPVIERNLRDYIRLQPDSANGYLLQGKHFYNKAVDLQKAGAGYKLLLSVLNEAIKSLKTCTQKEPDPGSKTHRAAFELLITALNAAGRKEEAKAYTTKATGL